MRKISILFISNSFGDDTEYFMPYISRDFDIKLEIANLYIGGCEICRHLDNIKSSNKAYEYRRFDNKNMKWQNQINVSINDALIERNWDYIVLQEASHLSGKKDMYKLVPTLIEEVIKLINYKPIFLWNMTWAYSKNSTHPCFETNYKKDQEVMYKGILDNVKHIKEITDIKKIIPCGKVIQEARMIFDENLLHLPDGFHMSQPLGRYIVALTAIQTIFNVNISNCNFKPDSISAIDKNNIIKLVKNNIKSI